MKTVLHHTSTRAKLAVLAAVLALLFLPGTASAQVQPIQNYAVENPTLTDYTAATDGSAAAYYLVFLWRAVIFIGGLAVIIYFIQGAFDWINADGEAAKIATARGKITGALIGFIVLIGILVIIQFIEGVFGIKILNQTIPTAATFP